MSARLQAHAPYLHVLANGTTCQREGLLKGAKKELIYCLCECALNILRGNVKLHPSNKTQLKKHKDKLRTLADQKIPLKVKKELLLKQKGGWISALIVPVLASLAGLLKRKS